MTMADLGTVLLSETVFSVGGTIRWMSPELLDSPPGSNGRPTRESDCYALGMVIYEVSWLCSSQVVLLIHPFQVLTGLLPFHNLHLYTPVLAILRGERPEKPLDAEPLGLSDALWGLVRSCWSESSSTRPTARRLLDCLSVASLTWVPPPVYPVKAGVFSITDSDSSSGSLRTSLANLTGEGYGLIT